MDLRFTHAFAVHYNLIHAYCIDLNATYQTKLVLFLKIMADGYSKLFAFEITTSDEKRN